MAVSTSPTSLGSEPKLRKELLRIHDDHQVFTSFEAFSVQLPALMQWGRHRHDASTCVALLGLLEPLSGVQIEPRWIRISRDNLRESLLAGGCLSRHRAITRVLEHVGESLTSLRDQHIYLPETSTGFVDWLRRHHIRNLEVSDFLQDAEIVPVGVGNHQNLCALTYSSHRFDLVICNDVFEHVYDLPRALEEVYRVLRPGGRLLATFPMAFGQHENIIKAEFRGVQQMALFRGEPEYHGDPIRPTRGSLVYQIPGWQILDLASMIGFSAVMMHLVSSWKCGVLGGDLPGVFVADFLR
ncbi:class I SAM-dependent methyltransferase [Vulcanococcus sp.]|uniref:class I SAM-dependent methyltransferase n=1 Tax=Vulcanococcus sp. TaxID=2856995 RepID=UPI003F69EA4B